MAELDEVSLKLGSLEAGHEAIMNRIESMNGKMDQALNKLTLIKGSVEHAYDRMDDMEPKLDQAVIDGRDWRDTKTKAKWVLGLGFLGSAGGGLSFSKIISAVFGT